MPSIIQRSFAGGEISPELYDRAELEFHPNAVRKMRNFYPEKHGNLVNRPGSSFIDQTYFQTGSTGYSARLIPFIFSDSQTYVIVVTRYFFEFLSGGAKVGGGAPYQVAHTYLTAELPYLKFAQIGDVITICHPNHPPRELKRLGHTNWTLTDVSMEARPYMGSEVKVSPAYNPAAGSYAREWQWVVTEMRRDSKGIVWESAPKPVTKMHPRQGDSWSPLFTYGVGMIVEHPDKTGVYYASAQAGNNNHAVSDAAWWTVTTTFTSPEPEYGLEITFTGAVAFSAGRPLRFKVEAGYGGGLVYQDPNNPAPEADYFLGHRFYRGRGGILGWIGDTKLGGSFYDYGDEPDYSISPPQGVNPFKILNPDGSVLRTEKPAIVTFFEQRRIFARTNERPDFIFASKTGDFANFDRHSPLQASDGMEFELAGRKRQEIRSLVGGPRLMAFTGNGEWITGGARGEPLAPDSIDARMQSERGCNWLDPINYGDGILLYIQQKGTIVREFMYSTERESAQGANLSYPASHFFDGYTIVDWAFQEDPNSTIWAVRNDGALLSFVFIPDYKMYAWSIHTAVEPGGDTINNAYENVCCIPEGGEDAIYVVVRRKINGTIKRFLERFNTRVVKDIKEGIFLDCAKTYRGAPATVITGLDHLNGMTVNALADGNVIYNKMVAGGQIDISAEAPEGASVVHVGLPYISEMETLDVTPTLTRASHQVVKNVKEAWLRFYASRGLYVGESLEEPARMIEWRQREVLASYGPLGLFTEKVKIVISGRWGPGGRVAVQQRDPLPVTIVSVTREVEVGGS